MRLPGRFIDLLLISVGFALALFVYDVAFEGGLGLKGTILGTGASVIAFWAATEMRDGTRQEPLTDGSSSSNGSAWARGSICCFMPF